METGPIPSKEFNRKKENRPISNGRTVDVNTFRTRNEPLTLHVNGETGEWHSVKGGLQPEKNITIKKGTVDYEVLFNPDTNMWLKTIPISENPTRLEVILRKSIPITKAALEVAGLPEIAAQVKETTVNIRGVETYGFVCPHIGESLFSYKKSAVEQKEDPDMVKEGISTMYNLAFEQAVELYTKYGYWAEDPNPGNILLHEKDDNIHVVLIDFATKQQIKSVNPDKIPQNIAPSSEEKHREVKRRHMENIKLLRQKFVKQCEILGGEISSELDYEERYGDRIPYSPPTTTLT